MEPIHIRFEVDEAIDAKKALLNSEVYFINMAKNIRKFSELRKKEYSKKAEVKSKLGLIASSLNSIKKELPKTHLKKQQEEIEKTIEEGNAQLSLEDELKGIQKRLAKLAG